MSPDETIPPVDIQLEEVSDAIQRAAGDLLSARLVLDRERAEFVASAVRSPPAPCCSPPRASSTIYGAYAP